jgi:hypothetical protein
MQLLDYCTKINYVRIQLGGKCSHYTTFVASRKPDTACVLLLSDQTSTYTLLCATCAKHKCNDYLCALVGATDPLRCALLLLVLLKVLPKVAVSMCLGDSASVAASAADVADSTDDGCDCFHCCSCDFSYARNALRPL